MGQLVAQMALLSGARRVFLVEPNGQRRAFAFDRDKCIEPIDPAEGLPALQIKEKNDARPPDVVIECSGAVAGLHSAIQTAGIGGTVVAAGFYAGQASALSLGEEFLHNRVTIKASMGVWGCPSRFPQWDRARLIREAFEILAARKLNLEGFLSYTFKFDEAQQAYEAIAKDPGKYMKAALIY